MTVPGLSDAQSVAFCEAHRVCPSSDDLVTGVLGFVGIVVLLIVVEYVRGRGKW